MSLTQSCLGIDLREDRVIFSHLKKSFKQVWVTTNKTFSFNPQKVKEEHQAEIINIIQGFIGRHNFSKDNIVLGLPREKALVRLLEIPSAAKENLRNVLGYELGKYIPFPPEEAVFDFQILEERETILRILLVVMRMDEVNGYLELFKRMGIQPVAIEISSTASANLFYYDQHPVDQHPFVLIDIGKHFFEFHFFEKGGLKEVIHGSFLNDNEKAKEVAEAYRTAAIKGFVGRNGEQSLFAHGEEAKKDVIDELKEVLSPSLKSALSLKRIGMANGLEKMPESYPSIGLALRGLSRTRWNISLLPLNLRKKVSRIGIYLALLLSITSLVLTGSWAIHPFLQEREELNRILIEMKENKPKVDAIEAVQKKKDLLEKEVREFEALRREETSRVEILRELSDILPSTAWIWSMKLKSKDVEINGFADSASDLIAIFDKSPIFEKVEFSSPVTKERRLFGEQVEKERFRISAKIERAK